VLVKRGERGEMARTQPLALHSAYELPQFPPFERAEQRLRQQLQTGNHSPGEFRTNGIVIHFDAFHEAFATHPGDPMYLPKEERIRIW
jgi:hypothetical protein